jgi:carboxyl-terminal processing protease
VVLVNKGSASASEILAGVIKDYDLGPLVGQKTFGKGLVQTILPVGDGAAVAITTARYYTPKGGDIQTSHGIDPDKAVELPEKAQYLSDQDTQLQAGLDLLKQRIARGH